MKRRFETMDIATSTSINTSVVASGSASKVQQSNETTRNVMKNLQSTKGKKEQRSPGKSEKKIFNEIDPAIVKEKLVARVTVIPPNKDRKRIFHINRPSSFTNNASMSSSPTAASRRDGVAAVVPDSEEKFMKQKLIVRGHYGKCPTLSPDILKKSSMTMSQIISLRSLLLQQKSMFRNHDLQKQRKHLYELYQNGSTIVDLSRNMDYPPMNLFRTILSEMGLSKSKIKRAIIDPKEHLCQRGQMECIAAKTANCGLADAQKEKSILKYASDFEDIIADWLSDKGVSFVRQEQLVKEQTEEFGKPIVTPDFLLNVEINEMKISWIDCKAYYGANIPFNIKKMKKQMSRYIDHWGNGAIIYLMGYNETSSCIMEREGCTVLNAHDIVDCSSGEDSMTMNQQHHRHYERLLQLENLISETINSS